jgi:hypothetical protein
VERWRRAGWLGGVSPPRGLQVRVWSLAGQVVGRRRSVTCVLSRARPSIVPKTYRTQLVEEGCGGDILAPFDLRNALLKIGFFL